MKMDVGIGRLRLNVVMKIMMMISSVMMGMYGVVEGKSSVFFTECECLANAKTFTVINEGASLLSSAVLKPPNSVASAPVEFECPGVTVAGTFPTKSGVVANVISTSNVNNVQLTATAADGVVYSGQTRQPFEVFLEFEIPNTPAEFVIFQVTDLMKIVGVYDDLQRLQVSVSQFGVTTKTTQVAIFGGIAGTNSYQLMVGFALGNQANSISIGSFICGRVNKGDTVCGSTLAASGDLSFSSPNSILRILAPNGQNAQVTLRHFSIDKTNPFAGVDGSSGLSGASAIAAALLNGIQVFTLPPFTPQALPATEDLAAALDLKTLLGASDQTLKFSLTAATTKGGNAVPAAGSGSASNFNGAFQYTPKQDFAGTDEVTFSYGIDITQYQCTRSGVKNNIAVTDVPDAPVAQSPTPAVFAGFQAVLTDTLVAKDVDDQTNQLLNNGKFVVGSLPDGELFAGSTCSNSLAVGDEIDVNAGKVTLCFTADAGLQQGSTTSMTFIVIDADDNSDQGTIVFTVQSPVVITDGIIDTGTNFVQMNVNENGQGTFSVGVNGLDFAELQVEDDLNRPYRIEITEIVNPQFGVMRVGGTAVSPGQEFAENESFQYLPATNVFNANPTGGPKDLAGNLIGTCAASARVNEYCPISFKYKAKFLETEAAGIGQAFFIVQGINDGNPSIAIKGASSLRIEEGAGQNSGDLSSAILSSLEATIEILNDLRSDLFAVSLNIQASDGVTFRIKGSITGLDIEDEANLDCTIDRCTTVAVTAAPSLLSGMMNAMEVIITKDFGAEPRLTLTITGAQPLIVPVVLVTPPEPKFFDTEENIYYVSAGGGVLVIGILFISYRRYSANKKKYANDKLYMVAEDIVARPKGNKERNQRKPRETDVESGGKKSKRESATTQQIDPESDIFDWEKHYDENTKQPYFFNPKTGESSWDPPSIKMKSKRKGEDSDVGLGI